LGKHNAELGTITPGGILFIGGMGLDEIAQLNIVEMSGYLLP